MLNVGVKQYELVSEGILSVWMLQKLQTRICKGEAKCTQSYQHI
jgi:hypothetical protein